MKWFTWLAQMELSFLIPLLLPFLCHRRWIPECQPKLMLCISWSRLGQREKHPVARQRSFWGMWLCLLQHKRLWGNPPAYRIQNNNPLGLFFLGKNCLWRGGDYEREQNSGDLRTGRYSRIHVNCSWFLVPLAAPHFEVSLVSLTATWPRTVRSFISCSRYPLRRPWHLSR